MVCASPATAKSKYLNAVHLQVGGGYGFIASGRIDNNETLDDAEFSNGSLYNVRGGASIRITSGKNAFFGLAGHYRSARGTVDLEYDIKDTLRDKEISVQNTSIEFFFGWQFLNRDIRPYVYGGMGYALSSLRMVYDDEDHRASLEGNNLPFFAAAGLDYMVKKRVSIGGTLRAEYVYNLAQYGEGNIEVRMDYVPISALFHVGIHF